MPAGGWVGPGVEPTHLASTFDFLGAMNYTSPAYAARGPLSLLGECRYLTLLWGLNRPPSEMESEVLEAIRAGSAAVGFWIWLRPDGAKQDRRGYRVEEGGFEAIGLALGRAEADWFNYYRENLLGGDARFVVTAARLSPEELVCAVKNLGRIAPCRVQGAVDLSAIK